MTQTTPTVTLSAGTEMPLLGFGTWRLAGDSAYSSVLRALEVGYRHIDTATMYGNEREIGRALRDSAVPRAEVFLTTKLPAENAGRERDTLRHSLDALGVDAVDLWLVHWPPNGVAAPETWSEFIALRNEKLTSAIGVSNYSTAQIDELIDATGEAPAVNQIKWGPSLYDAGQVAQLRDRNVVLEGYSPFRTTNLSHPALLEIASAHGVRPEQVVVRWHIDHGFVVIPKSANPERIASNADVFGFTLSAEELARLDGL
jgi:2,5-diketo-D-gluconate reductase A